MPAGIPSTYTPAVPQMTLEVNIPPSLPLFTLIFVSLPIRASTPPICYSFSTVTTDHRWSLTQDISEHLARSRVTPYGCLILFSQSHRWNIGGHHRFLEALWRHSLSPIIIGSVLVLCLPALSTGQTGTPGPLDPGDISQQNVFIETYLAFFFKKGVQFWSSQWKEMDLVKLYGSNVKYLLQGCLMNDCWSDSCWA